VMAWRPGGIHWMESGRVSPLDGTAVLKTAWALIGSMGELQGYKAIRLKQSRVKTYEV